MKVVKGVLSVYAIMVGGLLLVMTLIGVFLFAISLLGTTVGSSGGGSPAPYVATTTCQDGAVGTYAAGGCSWHGGFQQGGQ